MKEAIVTDIRQVKRVEVKPIWTGKDLDELFWHTCDIRAIAFDTVGFDENDDPVNGQCGNLMLWDIDYTFKYQPSRDGSCYEKMVSPCTLVFNDALKLSFHFDMNCLPINPVISDMKWGPSKTHPLIFDVHVDLFEGFGNCGTITFESSGFTMYVRKEPMAPINDRLTIEQRGGICFDRTTIDQAIVLEDPREIIIESKIKYH